MWRDRQFITGFVKINLKFNFWHLKLIYFQLEESFEDDDHPPEAAADNHHEDPETEENGNEQPEEENGDKVGQRIYSYSTCTAFPSDFKFTIMVWVWDTQA